MHWRFRAHDLLEFPPSIYRNALYFCTEHGYVYCLDAATSNVLWRYRLHGEVRLDADGRRARPSTSPRSAAASSPSTARPERPRWQIAGFGAIESSPLVWRGRVFFGSLDDHVYAVELKTPQDRLALRHRRAGQGLGRPS